MSVEASPAASLLTLPSELRNAIYLSIFNPGASANSSVSPYTEPLDQIAIALKLHTNPPTDDVKASNSTQPLHLLETCKQIHHEAHLLALSLTAFHISGEACYPDCFAQRASALRSTKISAIRHLTLTAKIAHLRALNESWGGLPFGNASLDLDTLTIVPKKPDASYTSYAEVADLSQCHTLAYILAETFKRLRNVRVVQVRNSGCFNEVVWRLVYRGLIYRMWRWGGERCGVRFECCGEEDEAKGDGWFRVWLKDGEDGSEVGDEVLRMVGGGGDLPDPNIVGF